MSRAVVFLPCPGCYPAVAGLVNAIKCFLGEIWEQTGFGSISQWTGYLRQTRSGIQKQEEKQDKQMGKKKPETY